MEISPDDSKAVVGPDGQCCASARVLERVLEVYSHISANVFKGGANGKIAGESMLCQCQYDPGKTVLTPQMWTKLKLRAGTTRIV